TVTDDDTGAGSKTTSVTVNNANPVVTAVSASPSTVTEGGALQATASFTDAGTQDTHTVVISWGDGSTSAATVTESGGSGTFTASHTSPNANPSTPSLHDALPISTVTDDDTGAGSKTTSVTVNNANPVVTAVSASP